MNLLSYEQACEAVHATIPTTRMRPHEDVSVSECLGRSLAAPIYATSDYPGFDNSAVDGYAIGFAEDGIAGKTLRVSGSCRAGGGIPPEISAGCAMRVFTGAAIPANCCAIIMQEDADLHDGEITIRRNAEIGSHIRRKGLDFKAASQLLSPGATLGPGHIALLASQGISTVRVFTRVRCGILTTGDELVEVGEKLEPGQIYDSNTPMLMQMALTAGCRDIHRKETKDERAKIKDALSSLCSISEVVIVSGGASVGDHDHIASVVRELGDLVFHGVRIKPGKPALFGVVGDSFVFGLPGNPGAAFVCFELFVRDAIRRLGGHSRSALRWASVDYQDAHPSSDRDDFVRCVAAFEDGNLRARRVREQGSFGLMSLAEANALVRIPAGETQPGKRAALLLGSSC
jgi:molybdopterin molybdotransferase